MLPTAIILLNNCCPQRVTLQRVVPFTYKSTTTSYQRSPCPVSSGLLQLALPQLSDLSLQLVKFAQLEFFAVNVCVFFPDLNYALVETDVRAAMECVFVVVQNPAEPNLNESPLNFVGSVLTLVEPSPETCRVVQSEVNA